MINYDSIISVFNEKGTLLKWLKKVEKALKESVLTNVEVLQGQDNLFAFKFTFQDNTSLTTDYVTIEPNISAALLHNYIEGSDTIVVDLNELQSKLIVKLDEEYKKTLATKTDIENLESELATKQNVITDSADIVKQGTGLVFSNSAEAQIASMVADIEDNKTTIATKQNVIIDSEEIVKHTAENDKLYLNNTISNKINNSMQLPTTAPTTTELVGIDTNKAQVNIGIGDGLSLENGTLKASGGDGSKLYLHTIKLSWDEIFRLQLCLLSSSATKFTKSQIVNKVINYEFNSSLSIKDPGTYEETCTTCFVVGTPYNGGKIFVFFLTNPSINTSGTNISQFTAIDVTNKVNSAIENDNYTVVEF